MASPISTSESLLSPWEEDMLKAKVLELERFLKVWRREGVKRMNDKSSLLIEVWARNLYP